MGDQGDRGRVTVVDAAVPARRNLPKPVFVAGILLITIGLGTGVAAGLGAFTGSPTKALDGTALARSLTLAATQAGQPATVTCPSHEPLKKGTKFTCTALAGTSRRVVNVTEVTNSGLVTYTGLFTTH
jgi:hypothetical protein